MKRSMLIGTGSYVPHKILTNDELSKIVDTNDSWIIERTGIKQRHIAGDNELTSDMATLALRAALENSHLNPQDLDGIILATTTPDVVFPASAVRVQQKLGLRQGFAFDLNAVCTGFVYALTIADTMLMAKTNLRRIAVIGAETMSRIVNWQDRSTCILFGDGAGAVILESCDLSDKATNIGIIDSDLQSDGSFWDILKVDGGTAKGNFSAKIEMKGREVFKNAIDKVVTHALHLLQRCGVAPAEIDWLLPHQANYRMMQSLAQRIGIAPEKIISSLDKHANTSGASIPLALDTYIRQNIVKKGELILMVAMGGGLTWGSILIRI